VPAVARSRKALCLFGMTNDGDLEACAGRAFFDMGSSFLSSAVGPLIQTYFLRHILPGMDWIIVQNMAQAARCQELDIPYHIIPSIVEPPPVELLHLPEEVDVVWVGNIISDTRRSKGVTELVALIRLLPHIQFEIIGELSAPGIQPILNELKQYSNVRLIGRLSYYETLAKIAQSRLVINTSPQEGFSNVMLEAWSLGKPTITLHVNPDKLLRNNGLGACAQGNLKKMSMMISDLLDDRRKLKAMNEECREYIEKTHFPEIVCRSFENMIGG
jgi:glycosyltransferase involved in cell wall biosynthesis